MLPEQQAEVHAEGSPDLAAWVDLQKQRLFDDDADAVVAAIAAHLDAIAKKGPGNKLKRACLDEVLRYLKKRTHLIRYGSLRRRDLEIASGAVEGAVKHVIARRFDHGGMRWIFERALALPAVGFPVGFSVQIDSASTL